MGYTTTFEGAFTLTPAANAEQILYINKFSETRRMKRSSETLQKLFDGNFGLEGKYGTEGEYFIGGSGFMGQDSDESVLDYNDPSKNQPGLWCKWVISPDGKTLYWSGSEKFYYYVEWLEYLIEHFFMPWKIVLNGEVSYQGENMEDYGVIFIDDNQVTVTM